MIFDLRVNWRNRIERMKGAEMKSRLTNERMVAFWNMANALVGNSPGAIQEKIPKRFAYAIARNMDKLEKKVKAFEVLVRNDAEYQEYEKKRMALIIEFADKDKNDKPVTLGKGIYQVKERELEFNEKLEELNEKCKDALEDHEKDLQAEVLDEQGEQLEYYALDLAEIPDLIRGNAIRDASFFIVDKSEEEKSVKEKK